MIFFFDEIILYTLALFHSRISPSFFVCLNLFIHLLTSITRFRYVSPSFLLIILLVDFSIFSLRHENTSRTSLFRVFFFITWISTQCRTKTIDPLFPFLPYSLFVHISSEDQRFPPRKTWTKRKKRKNKYRGLSSYSYLLFFLIYLFFFFFLCYFCMHLVLNRRVSFGKN